MGTRIAQSMMMTTTTMTTVLKREKERLREALCVRRPASGSKRKWQRARPMKKTREKVDRKGLPSARRSCTSTSSPADAQWTRRRRLQSHRSPSRWKRQKQRQRQRRKRRKRRTSGE
jgi:hypothetical protein